MRLGILPFGERDEAEATLAEALAADKVDLVLADAPVTDAFTARGESSRLHRADCDGVLLMIAAKTQPHLVAEAALFLPHVPLMLSGDYTSTFLDSAGALAAIGVPFERPSGRSDAPLLLAWLRENCKTERQRGHEAVRKLYGQRLILPHAIAGVDRAAWMHHFGVIVTHLSSSGTVTEDISDADETSFASPDGDAYGALTRRLLSLIGKGEPVYDLLVGAVPPNTPPVETRVTVARISPRRGRCRCVVTGGILHETRFATDCDTREFQKELLSSRLHAVPGDHLGALRAACEALDIEPILLR